MKQKQKETNILMTIDLSQYIGKWVAIVDDMVISVGDSGNSVFLEAKEKHPDKEVSIMKVPKNEKTLI